jgi:predicted aldo/keto reductase-like oxidoreductase
MRLTANILKAMHLAHKETCPRCRGGSPCPTEIHLAVQWEMAVLSERPKLDRPAQLR